MYPSVCLQSLVSSCDSTGTPSLVIEQTVTGFCHLIGISCIVMVVHEDIKDMQSTVSSLSHTAATIVTVKPLSTGMSAEIEAQIEIYRRSIDTSQLHSNNVEQKQQHQRLGYCQHSILRVSRSWGLIDRSIDDFAATNPVVEDRREYISDESLHCSS